MHLTLERIDAMNDDRLKITLRIADLKTPLALRVDYGADEKYWRDAADLFNKRWAFYKDKYKDGLMDSESMMATDIPENNGTEKRDNSCTATGPSKGQVGIAFFITII